MKGLRAFFLGTAAASAVLSCAVSAQAADLPSRVVTPVAPVVTIPSWTGFYVGIEGGADIGRNNYTTTAVPAGFAINPPAGAGLGQTSGKLGGYVGYNYQITNYVIGLEGDASYIFGTTKSTAGIPGTIFNPVTLNGYVNTPSVDSISASSKYDASIRGRAGYLITPAILAYATGGVAFRDANYTANCPGGGANSPVFLAGTSACTNNVYYNTHTTQVGWTVGGGIEGFVAPNWLLRAEYRYSDYGTHNNIYVNDPAANLTGLTGQTHQTTNTVTVGLAYKFSLPDVAPVVARY